jgi:hypothetical protein
VINEAQRVFGSFRTGSNADVAYEDLGTPREILHGVFIVVQLVIADCILVRKNISKDVYGSDASPQRCTGYTTFAAKSGETMLNKDEKCTDI